MDELLWMAGESEEEEEDEDDTSKRVDIIEMSWEDTHTQSNATTLCPMSLD